MPQAETLRIKVVLLQCQNAGSVFKHMHSTLSYFACICEWSSQTLDSVEKYTPRWSRSFRNVIYSKGNMYARQYKTLKRKMFLKIYFSSGFRSLSTWFQSFLYLSVLKYPDVFVSSFKHTTTPFFRLRELNSHFHFPESSPCTSLEERKNLIPVVTMTQWRKRFEICNLDLSRELNMIS